VVLVGVWECGFWFCFTVYWESIEIAFYICMALLETEFVGAIEEFAAQWQKSCDEHERSDWEDVRVLERVR
jgi:hypothetical protein